MALKIEWTGQIIWVQPRIRLTRSFDERSHSYLGYVLLVRGRVGGEERYFCVGVGPAAHRKHEFQVGQHVSGHSERVPNIKIEPVDFYKTSAIRVRDFDLPDVGAPPWLGVPPPLETYRARGHRRLASRTFESRCRGCIWGCRMPVELIIDHWNPQQRKYRCESFCYGPKSCSLYKAGPTRKVPGRRGMSWEEEDWVDEEATAHRGPDD